MEEQPASPTGPEEHPGFIARGRIRRRVRFLRKARELAYRDLGGLVFNLHRYGQRNDALVLAKLTTLGHIDSELRALERTLREPQPLTVLSEAGITACARCAAIHSSEDRFCPNCGLPLHRHADLPADLRAGPTPPAAEPAQPAAAPPGPPTAGVATPVPPAPPRGSQATSSYETVTPPVREPQQRPSPHAAPVNPATAEHPAATPPGGVPDALPEPKPAVAPGAAPGDDESTAIIRPPANRQ